jgi:hypothetical protein
MVVQPATNRANPRMQPILNKVWSKFMRTAVEIASRVWPSQMGTPLRRNPSLRDWRKNRFPPSESGGEHARSPNAPRGSQPPGIRVSVWTACVFSTAFGSFRKPASTDSTHTSRIGTSKRCDFPGTSLSRHAPQSGGERAALQTLRVVWSRSAVAKRLDCGGFSTAFLQNTKTLSPFPTTHVPAFSFP